MGKSKKNLTKAELAFISELSKYQGQWIAYEKVGRIETILASGMTLSKCHKAAEKEGVLNRVTFMKVPRSDRVLMPSFRTL